jgi:hypothetical protein
MMQGAIVVATAGTGSVGRELGQDGRRKGWSSFGGD